MDEKAARTWRWFRWAAAPIAALVLYATFAIGFRLTDGAGASGEGWLVVLGGLLGFAVLLAAAAALRLPVLAVTPRIAGLVLLATLACVVLWAAFVTMTAPACASITPASC